MIKNWEKYGIRVPAGRGGKIKMYCPQCHDSRTDKRDKSLSVNLDDGWFRCHYCGFSGNVCEEEEWERQARRQEWFNSHPLRQQKKEYKKPAPHPEKVHAVSEKALKWFESRGISKETVEAMKVTEGMEWMPQKDGEVNTVQFNYYRDGELVNTKFRTGDKKFKLVSGAELIPYNLDNIKGAKECIITEGECFDDKAQVLTQSGWKPIKDVGCDLVAQWEDGRITFAAPLAKVCKPYNGDLIEFSNARNNYYSLTTPEHNLIVERVGKVHKMHAEDVKSQINVVRTGVSNGVGIPLTDDMLRLLVAISADFTIRKKGDLYAGFKKKRKIERVLTLLRTLRIKHTVNPNIKNGYTNVFIHRGGIKAFKEFPFEWLYLANTHQIKVLLEELVFWDGNSVNDRIMKVYSTKLYHNAVWVQTLCHLGGMVSTIMHRKNEYGEWYKVSMLQKQYSSICERQKKRVPYNGIVYCLTMPAGTLLVRQNDIVTVSGNCDALTFWEVGYHNVISVPNGANANLEWLDDYMEAYFDDKEVIYVAADGDTKGEILKQELVRRFGAERCRVVEYMEGCKDANEVMMKYGKEAVKSLVTESKYVKIDGVFTVSDFETSLDKLYREGMQKGVTIGHENFDSLCTFETKKLCVVTGLPSSGKSEFIDEIAERLNVRYNWKWGFFSPENSPLSYHASKLIMKFTGKKFGADTLSIKEYEMAKKHLEKDFSFICPEDNFRIDTILVKAKVLVRRKGIKGLVIDPYNRIESAQGSMSETQYISQVLDKLINFAKINDVLVILMAHPTKLKKNNDGIVEMPTQYDISGSAHFFNKEDYGLAVHRHRNNGDDHVEVQVQKVRFRHLGECGSAMFKYNLNNGRYVPYFGQAEIAWDNTNHLITRNVELQKEAAQKAVIQFDSSEGIQPNRGFENNTGFDDNGGNDGRYGLPY